jgi:hypothetical protein
MTNLTTRASLRNAVLAALVALTLSPANAAAQDNNAPASAPAASAQPLPPQARPAEKPGFLHQVKVWWDDSLGFFGKRIDDTRNTVGDVSKKTGDVTKGAANVAGGAMKGAVEATKDAAATIAKLPNTRLIDVRERCAKAPNGAPDCNTAAANGCRAKGFSGGRPLEVRTAENCDTTALRAGQMPGQHECPVDTTVTRAVCQ